MSLVELLTVVSVLGILTAIAMSVFGGATNAKAKESRDRRNAQTLASLFQGAQASGLSFYVAGDLSQTVDNIVAGGTAADGVFAGTYFGMPGLQGEAQERAETYLILEDGFLKYNHPGS